MNDSLPEISYANLLQEFLLALLSHTGNVFIDSNQWYLIITLLITLI